MTDLLAQEFEWDYFEPQELLNLLAPGSARFLVTNVTSKTSKSGNAMLVIDFEVIDANSKTGACTEYLVRGTDDDGRKRLAGKIRNIANAIGKPQLYEKGYKLKAADFIGEQGSCVIKTQEADGKFEAKSVIAKYLPKDMSKVHTPNVPDDEVPF